jgi:hypothetical protein
LNNFNILVAAAQIHPGPGRPAIEYWLNKQQALFITAKSDGQGGTTSASIARVGSERPKRSRRLW